MKRLHSIIILSVGLLAVVVQMSLHAFGRKKRTEIQPRKGTIVFTHVDCCRCQDS